MSERFRTLVDLMARLRAPDGCPWDRKQTHESLKPYLLEETYEVLETIDQGDRTKLKEELGDVLLQVLFHSQIAAEARQFTIEDVIGQLADKLVRRHPHVFGNGGAAETPSHPDQVVHRWEEIKRAEREAAGREESVLDAVPKTLPALLRAYQLQARASRVGFDWTRDAVGFAQMLEKIDEEIRELRQALSMPPGESAEEGHGTDIARRDAIEAEFGDILFSLVNLARFIKINPEDALRRANQRFVDRFHHIEAQAARAGRALSDVTLAEMEEWWEEAKRLTRAEPVPGTSEPSRGQS